MRAEDVAKNFPGIIDVLRYHVAVGRFSYVDRMASAMDARVVEETVREALRAALSAASSPRRVEAKKVKYDGESKKYRVLDETATFVCCETEEIKRSGEVSPDEVPERVFLHGSLMSREGRIEACFTPPKMPSEEELASFIDAVRRDLEIARVVASLAMVKK